MTVWMNVGGDLGVGKVAFFRVMFFKKYII